MRSKTFFFLIFSMLMFFACDKDQGTIDRLNGYVQKGPFLNGTEITLSEMSETLSPTGRVFTTQVINNNGTFTFDNISLNSSFVKLKADGFYFNEVKNDNSTTRLTLYAVADLSVKSSLNVNILTTLENGRVEYLMENGASFSEAKQQAEEEVLKIFEIRMPDIVSPEYLDITKAGDGNAVLLAVSLITQGNMPVSGLSELLAGMAWDIREDGMLDSMTLGNTLVNNATYLNLSAIRHNLEEKYAEIGDDVTIPDFEKYVRLFLDSTNFNLTTKIEYPENGAYGTNLLDRNKTDYMRGDHSLCAVLPAGTTLKVKLYGRNWLFQHSQDWSGWEAGDFNPADTSVTLTSKKTGKIDLKVLVQPDTTGTPSRVIVFENGAGSPTWSKDITINTN